MAKNKNKGKKFGLLLSGKFDIVLIIVTILLLCIGLIILLSASAPTALAEDIEEANSYKYVSKQAIVAVIGFFCFTLPLSKIDYRIYRKLKWLIYVVCIVLLIVVGLTGMEEGGGRRWIRIFGFSFQPSEFAKVGFVLFYASLLSDIKDTSQLAKSSFSPISSIVKYLKFVRSILTTRSSVRSFHAS